ncbi:MAG: BMC domain-containing protein [Clostridia bacterium]|nr:BMC domain-containing protein [Clostridia bacterium]
MNAFGMIEVYSLTTALCAADVMVKAADVKLIAFDRNRPFAPKIPAPLIMGVKVEGSVAAVKAAVEAGAQAASKLGELVAQHVIPRPHGDVEKILPTI